MYSEPPRCRLLLAAAIAVYCVLLIVLSVLKHATYHSSLIDLGIFDQVIWNTAHGRWFWDTLDPYVQVNHVFLALAFSPGLAVLAPLYWFAPSVNTLFVVQTLALAAGISRSTYWRRVASRTSGSRCCFPWPISPCRPWPMPICSTSTKSFWPYPSLPGQPSVLTPIDQGQPWGVTMYRPIVQGRSGADRGCFWGLCRFGPGKTKAWRALNRDRPGLDCRCSIRGGAAHSRRTLICSPAGIRGDH